MKYNFFSFLIVLCICKCSLSQTTNEFISFLNFTPASPEISLFQRYGNIPVNYSSGIPVIEIPLLEIQSGQLSVPVNITYHASGIKVEDIASPVGLGWVLNAGGSISRTILGLGDESESIGFLNLTNFLTNSQLLADPYFDGDDKFFRLWTMSEGVWDTQSDEYYINLPQFSCRFLYDTNKVIRNDAVNKQIKIFRDLDIDIFTIIDDSGIKYFFTEKEYTTNIKSGFRSPTAWMLTKILSNDGRDSIVFKYKNAAKYSDNYVSNQYIIRQVNLGGYAEECCMSELVEDIVNDVGSYEYERLILDSIILKSGRIKINYLLDREDPLNERIKDILVYNEEGLMKVIALNQSYFESEFPASGRYNKRLKLNGIDIKDPNLNTSYSYVFAYNPITLPAYRSPYKSIEYDYWGYYNGNGANLSNNKTLIPSGFDNYLINYILSRGYQSYTPYVHTYNLRAANRNPNDYYAAACILEKIIYPTKGYTYFEYEGNRTNNSLVGGLRIKKITNYDSNNTIVNQKVYTYGNEDGCGIEISPLLPHTFFYWQPTITPRICGYYSPLLFENCEGMDFIISSYSTAPINFFNGSPVFYDKVTEIEGIPNNNIGKTIYYFDYDTDKEFGFDAMRCGGFRTNRNWIRGQLLNKQVYNSQGILIKETKNYYEQKGVFTVKTGFICERTTRIEGLTLETFLAQESPWHDNNLFTYFDLLDIEYDFGTKLLTKTEEYEYLPDLFFKVTNYFYESPNHLYMTKKNIIQSDNSLFVEQYLYPQDNSLIEGLTPNSFDALNDLIAQNVLTPTIEKIRYRDTVLLEVELSEYKIFSNNVNKPEFIKRKIGQNPFQTEISLNYDSRGNLVEYSKRNETKKSFIWGYKDQYLLAEITNASYYEISSIFPNISLLENGNFSEQQRIRQALPEAMITFYTYKPLVGMTSMTDPNGITTYYEYDSVGRLKIIRDHDGRILKTFDYNYKQ